MRRTLVCLCSVANHGAGGHLYAPLYIYSSCAWLVRFDKKSLTYKTNKPNISKNKKSCVRVLATPVFHCLILDDNAPIIRPHMKV